MCALCGVVSKEHWTEAGGGVRARVFRAAVLNRVLDHYGLAVEAWAGSYVLRDRKGGAAVVADIGALWVAAERLAGVVLDPLDPALVAALAR